MKSVPILSGHPDSLFMVNTQTKEVQPTKLHKLIKSGIGIFLLICLGVVPITVPIPKTRRSGLSGSSMFPEGSTVGASPVGGRSGGILSQDILKFSFS